jgi:anaerobic magnesium-protoporphyrin IX monomethyl ester cyclase
MADILLTHSNHVFFDRKQTEKMQPYPPLQTMLAAAVLRQHGIDAALFDPTLEPPEAGFEKALKHHRPRMVVVCEDDFNFLSKMCLIRNRELAFWMAQKAGEQGIAAAVHGSDASDHASAYIGTGFSAVLIGEVEATLIELAQGRPLASINGLVYGQPGAIHYNRPRAVEENLDSLPLPAWDLIDIQRYRHAWMSRHSYFSLNMVSSRGCPFHCNWCAKPIYGNSYHARSPRAVAAEMYQVKTRFNPGRIWFADDIFALSPRWTLEFADAVEEMNACVPFKMQSRCDLMTRDTVAALRRAGCEEVWMGAESGSQRILDAMDKGILVEHIYKARENLARHGIRACLFLQFGYLGEDWSDIHETIQMVRQTQPDDVGVSVSYPLPGTKFHQIVSAQLGVKQNWSDSADLSMMFRGTYPTEFYRALTEAVHLEVRGGDGLNAAWRRVRELQKMAQRRVNVA